MKRIVLVLMVALIVFVAPIYAVDKVSVKLSCFPALDQVYKALIPGFCKQNPNVKVEVTTKGYGDHHNSLLTAISDPSQEVPDLALVEIGYLADLIALNGFSDLNQPPFSAMDYKTSIFPYKWAQATSDEGKLVGFPYDVAPGCAYWRRDFFNKVGINIDDIKTIEDLFAAAGKLTIDTNGDGKTDQWFTSRASDIAYMILRSDPDRQLFFDQDGRCIINKERVKEALL